MSDLSRKHVLSDIWNTIFIKMGAISIMDRGGQPIHQLSMLVVAHRVEAGLFCSAFICHYTKSTVMLWAAPLDLLWVCLLLRTSAFPLQGTCKCLGLNWCLTLQTDSQSFLNSQMLFPVPHFLPNAPLHLQLLQQAKETVPEMLLGVALPPLLLIFLGQRLSLDDTLSPTLWGVWPIQAAELSCLLPFLSLK